MTARDLALLFIVDKYEVVALLLLAGPKFVSNSFTRASSSLSEFATFLKFGFGCFGVLVRVGDALTFSLGF